MRKKLLGISKLTHDLNERIQVSNSITNTRPKSTSEAKRLIVMIPFQKEMRYKQWYQATMVEATDRAFPLSKTRTHRPRKRAGPDANKICGH